MLFVSVIVPCRNEENYIQACLKAILANQSATLKLEILVIDGESNDQTRARVLEIAAQYPEVQLLDNPAQITPVAFNLGLAAAQGLYIQIVGAHQILAPDYITLCLTALLADPQLGGVGGHLLNQTDSKLGESIAAAMASPFGVGPGNFRTLQSDDYVDTISTPLYRCELLQKLGGFDPQLVRNQDDDLNYRIRKEGWQLLQLHQAKVNYYVRSSWPQLQRQYYQYGFWKVYVNRKNQAVTTGRQLVPPAFVLFVSLGACLSLVWLPFRYLYLFVNALYVSLATLAAFRSRRAGAQRRQILRAFLTMHLFYGVGYLEGCWRFLIRRQSSQARHQRLSR